MLCYPTFIVNILYNMMSNIMYLYYSIIVQLFGRDLFHFSQIDYISVNKNLMLKMEIKHWFLPPQFNLQWEVV